MARKKNTDTIINFAYSVVNGIPVAECEKAEHKEVISKALQAVWVYPGLYPGETEDLREERMAIEGPDEGNPAALADHFRQLDASIAKNMPWEIVFIMYNRMKDLEPDFAADLGTQQATGEPSEEDAAPATGVDEAPTVETEEGSSDIENKNKTKENETMSKTNEGLAELQAAIAQTSAVEGGSIVIENGALPVSAEFKAAASEAKKSIENDFAARIAYSKKAVASELVQSKPAAIDVAVAGEKATGTIKDPKKVLEAFVKKTGYEQDQVTGDLIFKNIPTDPDNMAAARAMYETLKAAIDNPAKEFDVYFSKSNPAIKGAKVVTGEGGEGTYLRMSDLISLIVSKTVGALRTTKDGVQLRVNKSRPSTKKGGKGTGTAKAKASKDSYSGVATVAIVNRVDGIAAIGSFHKEKTDKTSVRSGMKSVASVKYYRDTTDAVDGADRKTGTYRIPLMVDQYDLEVIDTAKLVLGTGAGAGNQIQPINLDDNEALKGMIGELVTIAATAAVKGIVGNDLIDKIRAGANQAVAAEAQAQAGSMEDTGL